MQRYVAGFMFDEAGEEALLVRKNKPEWQRGLYNGVGGKIEAGELPIQAMIREFEEEACIKTDKREWKRFCTITGGFGSVYFYYCFSNKMFDAKPGEEELVKIWSVERVTKGLVPVISNLLWLIPLALDTQNVDYSIKAGSF